MAERVRQQLADNSWLPNIGDRANGVSLRTRLKKPSKKLTAHAQSLTKQCDREGARGVISSEAFRSADSDVLIHGIGQKAGSLSTSGLTAALSLRGRSTPSPSLGLGR